MTVQVTGVLVTPFNLPAANIPIKVITTVGAGDTLPTSEAIYYTDSEGNYDFELVFATHEIYAMFDDAFELIGPSVVNESVPSPSTIGELLYYTTPIQPPIVDDIYDNVYGCIDCVENAFDTCTTQLSEQVVQGDTGVCESMTVYTNERLQACSAELTTAMQAGDAQVLQQAQVYTDATGTEISCCTTALQTGLTEICSTFNTYTDANDTAVAEMCTNMEAGDAQVLQQATAHSDACTGSVESSLYNLVQACDAAAYVCMNAISTELGQQTAGYSIVTTAGEATASISLLAESMEECDISCSTILMQADKIAMHNGDPTNTSYPFCIADNQVYISNAAIECLVGKDICAGTFYGGLVTGSTFRSTTFNSVNNPAGGPPVGFCINGTNGNAEVRDLIATNAYLSGTIEASAGYFCGALCAASGTFTGTLCGANGYFAGTVCADKIIGDLVSAVAKGSTERELFAQDTRRWYTSDPIVSYYVQNARPYSRTFNTTIEASASTIKADNNTKNILIKGRIDGDFGAVETQYINWQSFSGVAQEESFNRLLSLAITIPANTTGWVHVRGMIYRPGEGFGATFKAPFTNNLTIGYLFRNGGDMV